MRRRFRRPGDLRRELAVLEEAVNTQHAHARLGGRTPALALTVLSARAEQERILASGFQIYRQKPIEPADLAHDIARLAASRVA